MSQSCLWLPHFWCEPFPDSPSYIIEDFGLGRCSRRPPKEHENPGRGFSVCRSLVNLLRAIGYRSIKVSFNYVGFYGNDQKFSYIFWFNTFWPWGWKSLTIIRICRTFSMNISREVSRESSWLDIFILFCWCLTARICLGLVHNWWYALEKIFLIILFL